MKVDRINLNLIIKRSPPVGFVVLRKMFSPFYGCYVCNDSKGQILFWTNVYHVISVDVSIPLLVAWFILEGHKWKQVHTPALIASF